MHLYYWHQNRPAAWCFYVACLLVQTFEILKALCWPFETFFLSLWSKMQIFGLIWFNTHFPRRHLAHQFGQMLIPFKFKWQWWTLALVNVNLGGSWVHAVSEDDTVNLIKTGHSKHDNDPKHTLKVVLKDIRQANLKLPEVKKFELAFYVVCWSKVMEN